MKNIKKNKYGKDMAQLHINIPVNLLNDLDVIAEYLNINRSAVIISSLGDLARTFKFDDEFKNYNRNTIKSIYRKEQKK